MQKSRDLMDKQPVSNLASNYADCLDYQNNASFSFNLGGSRLVFHLPDIKDIASIQDYRGLHNSNFHVSKSPVYWPRPVNHYKAPEGGDYYIKHLSAG